MASPKKNVNMEKENTMFGQLSNVEKQTSMLNENMKQELSIINILKNDLGGLQKQAKQGSVQAKAKLGQEIKQLEQRISLITQKAEYMRFSAQIGAMIQNGKELNSQLTLLAAKFDEFQKNVGVGCQ